MQWDAIRASLFSAVGINGAWVLPGPTALVTSSAPPFFFFFFFLLILFHKLIYIWTVLTGTPEVYSSMLTIGLHYV